MYTLAQRVGDRYGEARLLAKAQALFDPVALAELRAGHQAG